MQKNSSVLHSVRWAYAAVAILALALSPLRAADSTLAIMVKCSPAVVIMDAAASGDCLTVHTDLRFSTVDTSKPVELNGLKAYALFSDNRGNLVAKFNLTALRLLLAPPTTKLTMTGCTKTGVAFAGSDVVRVVE